MSGRYVRAVPPAAALGRSRAWALARWVAAGVVLAGLGLAAAANADELRAVELDVRPGWWLAAAPFTAAASVVLPLAWQRTVVGLGGRLAAGEAVRVWWVSQASRFVVTMVGAAAGRVAMAARAGVRAEVAAAAQVVELVLLVGWSALLGSLPGRLALAGPVRTTLVVGALAGLVLLPWWARAGLALVHRVRPEVDVTAVDRRALVGAEATYGVNAALRSVAFVLVAAGMLPVGGADVAVLVAGWNLAAVAGIVGITPAGIGVREGVMVALLQPRLGLGGAASLAAVWRAWELAFEVFAVAAVSALGRRRAAAAAGGGAAGQSSTT